MGDRFELGRVGIWTGVLDAVPSAQAKDIAAGLEAMGFPTLWIPETVGRDPFVSAALLLGATSALRVATGIANIYARDAVTMANTQRTLEEAFPGRFLLGLGVSHHHLVDRVRHHAYDKPYSRMVEYLEAMDHAIFRAVGPSARPATVLAALGPKMLRLAGENADGAHPYFVPVEHTAQAREILGPDKDLCVEMAAVISDDEGVFQARAQWHLEIYTGLPNYRNNWFRLGFTEDDTPRGGSDRLKRALVAQGEDGIRQKALDHFEAGASHVCVQVLGEHPADTPISDWRRLAPVLTGL